MAVTLTGLSVTESNQWLAVGNASSAEPLANDAVTVQVLKYFLMVNAGIRSIEGLLAIIGNGLTVMAIMRFEYLRSCTNYLVATLGIADMVGGVTALVLLANYLIDMSDVTWLYACTVEQTLNYISSGFNVWIIMWIAVDRFVFITYPLRYYVLMTERIVIGMVTLTTAIMIGLIGPLVFGGSRTDLKTRICSGGVFKSGRMHLHIAFMALTVITTVMYIWIAYVANKQSQQIARGQITDASSKKENKITKMLGLVLGMYLICYMPQVMLIWLARFDIQSQNMFIVERTFAWLWWVNSWANPLIYAWKNKDFARAFNAILRRNLRIAPTSN